MSVLTTIPPLAYGWLGRWRACRSCGRRDRPEIDEGLCVECAAEHFGEHGLNDIPPAWAEGVESMAMERPRIVTLPDGDEAIEGSNRWHPLHPACRDCGTTTIPHQSRGLCRNCYPAALKPGYTGNAAAPLTMAERAKLQGKAATPATEIATVMATPAPTVTDDAPQFEVFTLVGPVKEAGPALTIRSDGRLSMNAAALDALGQPIYVELLYDKARQVLGVRKASATVAHARRVGAEKSAPGRGYVGLKALLAHFKMVGGRAKQGTTKQYGDVLAVELVVPAKGR